VSTWPSFSFSQDSPKSGGSGSAAFLFSYTPKPGQRSDFENGYKVHLDWHRRNQDPLNWYAWYVVTGKRVGLFVDGTFGVALAALDNRVDPQGDRVDFAQTTAPFAVPESRSIFLLREDLSTARFLEDTKPSPMVQVHRYVIHVGKEIGFERILSSVKDRLENQGSARRFACYRLIDGGAATSYLLLMPRTSWADYAGTDLLSDALAEAFGQEASEYLKNLASAVKSTYSETWAYRSDLSYLPTMK
jgi:hypothetical protein